MARWADGQVAAGPRPLDSSLSQLKNTTNEPGMSMKTKEKVKMSMGERGEYGGTRF